MPASDPAQDDAPTSVSPNRIFVTGAGFTRALVPNAPLLVDDFGNDALADRVRGLPNASRLLEWERNQHPTGHIDIERLMTRVESLMPYDYADFSDNAANEYALLLSELKLAFLNRIREAGEEEVHWNELNRFAKYCAENNCDCITFNYDDFLDQALDSTELDGTRRWVPQWGYGFHCPSSKAEVSDRGDLSLYSSMLLLKLHGSINWWPKLGYPNPVPLDAITQHDDWSAKRGLFLRGASHLESEPVIVPPVLSKSSLIEQPVLRLVWSQAFRILQSAHEVTFVGYSFPTTDMAARTLFSEALKDLPKEDIHVVNLARDESDTQQTRSAYRSALGDIPDAQFQFQGALDWIGCLPEVSAES